MKVNREQKNHSTAFYKASLELLNEKRINYLLGGAFAFYHYTGIHRDTKDLDIYCKSGDHARILKLFIEKNYRTEVTDARWIGKVFKDEYYIDLIFDTPNGICPVDDSWFARSEEMEFAGVATRVMSAEELIWSKIYVQNRDRYDGADINHIILKYGKQIDWKHLLDRLDRHWHLLLSQVLNFQFIYPSTHHETIPRWLFDELIERAQDQYRLPPSQEAICRGPMLDQSQYAVDIKEWNYKTSTMKTV